MRIKHLESESVVEIFTVKAGGEERMVCPVCSKDRKKSRDKCFSWNHDKKTGFCSHCQGSFVVETEKKEFAGYVSRENREYKKPKWNNTELSDNVVKYFEARKISQMTLRQMRITEGMEFMPQIGKEINTIKFNYFRNEELINIKFRDGAKRFKLSSGAELILYNYDKCLKSESIIITEGEIDTLSIAECGLWNVTSPPNGAGTGALKMEYIDNCIELFENKTEIIIATDTDAPGVNLCNQLAYRLGIEKCFRVDFKPYKDANEYLCAEGATSLKNLIQNAKKPFPIEGIFTTDDIEHDLDVLWQQGLKPGCGIEISDFDKKLTFETGRLYTWTGIPGHGKSEFLDFILERLNIIHGWKTAYFSPENHPLQLHASKIIEKITGFHFSKTTMPEYVYNDAKGYVSDNYYFISPRDDFKVDTILEKARICVFKFGVKNIVIDPYNKLEHQFSGSETQYISQFLDKLTTFAKRNNVAVHLVAHPRKMSKNGNGNYDVPNLYDINGSANFFNKTDFGVSVYRTPGNFVLDVHIQKVKFKHMGETGIVQFMWNPENGRYAYFDGKDVHNVKKDNSNHLNTVIEQTKEEIHPQNNIDLFLQTKEVPF